MELKFITYEQEEQYGLIRLNRAEVLNAINKPLIDDLMGLLDRLENEIDPRVLIITGSERAFSAGADLKSVYTDDQSVDLNASDKLLDGLNQLMNRLEAYPKPIVAAIDGIAYGGGCELALACDFRIATTNAKIALSEVKIGLLPAGGGTQRLPRLIGLSRAKYMLLSGEPIDINTLMEWGLIHEVVKPRDLIQRAKEFSAPFINSAPLSLKAIKSLTLTATDKELSKGLQIERNTSDRLRESYDAREGISAFNQKRKPQFKGK